MFKQLIILVVALFSFSGFALALEDNTPPYFVEPLPDLQFNTGSGVVENVLYLPAYAADNETPSDQLHYVIASESNKTLVNCDVDLQQYLDCNVKTGEGFSRISLYVNDGFLSVNYTF